MEFSESIFLPKKYKVEGIAILLVPSFLFMYLGLAWHVIIMMGLNSVATSPGWYFHILMPLIAPLIGIAYSSISKNAFKAKLFISLLIYSFLFQLGGILLHAFLFGAAAFKGNDKSFVLNQNILTLDGISTTYNNLTIVSFPNLSFISFLLGFFLLAYLIIKIQSRQKEKLAD